MRQKVEIDFSRSHPAAELAFNDAPRDPAGGGAGGPARPRGRHTLAALRDTRRGRAAGADADDASFPFVRSRR